MLERPGTPSRAEDLGGGASHLGRPRMSRRGDWVTVALCSWLILGLFVDGWAHNTQPALETFFTPWHALFYSGFTATAAWVAWSVVGPARLRQDRRVWRTAVPFGYGYAVAGIAIFGVSGAGDLIWHQVFGIEQSVSALLSPTHLGLFTGALLIVTAPARSQAGDPSLSSPGTVPGTRALLPAIASLSLAGTLIGFILQAWHPLAHPPATFDSGMTFEYTFGEHAWFVRTLQIEAGVAGFLLGTVFLFGPLLWMARRWPVPAAAPMIAISLQVVLLQAMVGLESPELIPLGLLGAVAVAALTGLIGPRPQSLLRSRLFFGVAPPVFWLIQVIGLATVGPGLGWTPEVWGGSVVWSGLVGLGLTLLGRPDALTRQA